MAADGQQCNAGRMVRAVDGACPAEHLAERCRMPCGMGRWVSTLKEFSNRAAEYTEVFKVRHTSTANLLDTGEVVRALASCGGGTQSIPAESDRYLVIVEPRRYELLEHVLR